MNDKALVLKLYLYKMQIFKAVGARKIVNRNYVKILKKRYQALLTLPDHLWDCSLPLHVIAREARNGERQWKDVELLLSKFPPNMAKQALMWLDDYCEICPLHYTEHNAPRSIIERMLELEPEAAFIHDAYGELALHKAVREGNIVAVELLIKTYPRTLVVKDYLEQEPIHHVFQPSSNKHAILGAIIRGLIIGLTNNSSSTDFEKIVTIISTLIVNEYDCDSASQVFHNFIVNNDNGDDCDMYVALLKLHSIFSKNTDIVRVKPCLKIVFGNLLGMHIFSMAVEYRLLNIIERDENTKYIRSGISKRAKI